jgi:hypothetical protein
MRVTLTPSEVCSRSATPALGGPARNGPNAERSGSAGTSPASGLLTRRQLARLLLISSRTLDRRRGMGEILDPLPGPGQPRWLAAEVWAWVEAGRPSADAWRRLRPRRR